MPESVDTKYGRVFVPDGPCKDDYGNIRSDQGAQGGLVKLQSGAMNSFHSAERRLYKLMHPVKSKFKRNRKRREPIVLTGSWRSCELQRKLYDSDPKRFAPPDKTLHCRGLAIDVSMAQSDRKLRLIRKVLFGHDWHQSRPDDEPWHYSYHFEG